MRSKMMPSKSNKRTLNDILAGLSGQADPPPREHDAPQSPGTVAARLTGSHCQRAAKKVKPGQADASWMQDLSSGDEGDAEVDIDEDQTRPKPQTAMLLPACLLILATAIARGQLSPAEFQAKAGQGFSTNWFKTNDPLGKYDVKNVQDVFDRGFRNLRLRCRADLYEAPYDTPEFKAFLDALETVVDDCVKIGVVPIISWIHHEDEAFATDAAKENYVKWWTLVTERLEGKPFELAFNLFTELGIDGCGQNCGESLRENTDKYNEWTSEVVGTIRATGPNNNKRILILGSPKKTAKDLEKIDQNLYQNDQYMMAEWHIYASGPNKVEGSQKYWSGKGEGESKPNVDTAIRYATDFTAKSGLATYLGAWMPTDNKDGSLSEEETIAFARYFVKKLKEAGIPWSLNVLDRYYDTANSEWIRGEQEIKGTMVNMVKVLNHIVKMM